MRGWVGHDVQAIQTYHPPQLNAAQGSVARHTAGIAVRVVGAFRLSLVTSSPCGLAALRGLRQRWQACDSVVYGYVVTVGIISHCRFYVSVSHAALRYAGVYVIFGKARAEGMPQRMYTGNTVFGVLRYAGGFNVLVEYADTTRVHGEQLCATYAARVHNPTVQFFSQGGRHRYHVVTFGLRAGCP